MRFELVFRPIAKWCCRFCGAGVPPAVLRRNAATKIAGATNARPVSCYDPAVWLTAAVMRFFISSGETSSICEATDHMWPKGSSSDAERSP